MDDNIELANTLKTTINEYCENWEAAAVYNGSNVFTLLPTYFPDIVFCDIILPDMSGINVMKNLKEIEQDIQVIIMTAYASLSTSIEALQCGAFDYIPKPLHINQVINAIKSAEKKRKTLLENRKMIMNLLSLKDENKISDESREIIKRIVILKNFQKKVSKMDTKKKFLEITYMELSNIFSTKFISIFLKDKDEKFKTEISPKSEIFKVGEIIDEKMPIFYFPKKNGLGCIFPEEKSMTSIIGFENKIIGFVYYKRVRDFTQKDLETAELISIELGARLNEIQLNKKIDTDRSETIMAFLSIFGFSDAEEKRRVMNSSKMAVEFAEYLGLEKDYLEKIRHSSILYNIFRLSFALEMNLENDILKRFEEVSEDIDYLNNLKGIVLNVNENYDGSGKSTGLKKGNIPIGARILKILFTYLLLSENSDYRSGEKKDSILSNMEQKKGIYFDPKIMSKFKTFLEIYNKKN